MRGVQARVANHAGWLAVLYCINLALIALVFSIVENQTYGDSLWWGIVTSTTTGYGDFFPKTLVGRIAGTELMLTNILLVALIVSRVVSSLAVDLDKFSDVEQERMKHHLAEINAEGDLLRAQLQQLLEEQRAQSAAEADLLRAEVARLEQLDPVGGAGARRRADATMTKPAAARARFPATRSRARPRPGRGAGRGG